MKKHLLNRHEKLFTKLFESQGVKIKELGVPEMTAWQAIEEEEELEESGRVLIDPETDEETEEEQDESEEEEQL